MSNKEQYRNKVRSHLDKISGKLLDELTKILKFNFHPEIEILDFVIFSDGFTDGFPVRMFSMTRDANEFFHDKENDTNAYFSGGYDLLQEVEYVFSYDEIDFDYYEESGIDLYEEASLELIEWFSEIWNKVIGKKINIPSYICLHDDINSFDLINMRWISDDEKWI